MTITHEEFRDKIKSGDLLSFERSFFESWPSGQPHLAIALVLGERVFCIEAAKPYSRLWPLSLSGDYWHTAMPVNWTLPVEDFAVGKDIVGVKFSEIAEMWAYFHDLEPHDVSECAVLSYEILKKAGVDLGTLSTPDAVVAAAQLHGPTTFVENRRA